MTMPTIDFRTHVNNVLVSFGESSAASDFLVDKKSGVPRAQSWNDTVWAIGSVLNREMRVNPGRAIDMLTSVVHGLQARSVAECSALLAHIQLTGDLFRACQYCSDNVDARYALATCLLVVPHAIAEKKDLAKALSAVYKDSVELSTDPVNWRNEIAQKLFGPGWYSIYVEKNMSYGDVIELVLQHKPPFSNVRANDFPAVDMPADVACLSP